MLSLLAASGLDQKEQSGQNDGFLYVEITVACGGDAFGKNSLSAEALNRRLERSINLQLKRDCHDNRDPRLTATVPSNSHSKKVMSAIHGDFDRQKGVVLTALLLLVQTTGSEQ